MKAQKQLELTPEMLRKTKHYNRLIAAGFSDIVARVDTKSLLKKGYIA
jgi:hypothetical protein